MKIAPTVILSTLVCIGFAAEMQLHPGSVIKAKPAPTGPLKCFQCNSLVDPECGDDFDPQNQAIKGSFLATCEATATYCKKVKMWLNGETRIMRGCGEQKREYKTSCFQKRADDHIVDTCQCDDAECNSAPFLAGPATLFVMGAAAIALRV